MGTLQISAMPFLLWVALHQYFHSAGLLWIWLKNLGTGDTVCLRLAITWLSGRTSINDPAGRILNTVNRVKQNQNLGTLFCLLKRTRVLCVYSSACLWTPNEFKSFIISLSGAGGERHWCTNKCMLIFQLPLNFEDLLWHLMKTPKKALDTPHLLLIAQYSHFCCRMSQ